MKILLILPTFLTAQSLWAETSIQCSDPLTFSHISSAELSREIMTINYNFATAKLFCDFSSEHAVEEKRPFRCAGMWTFDLRRPDQTTGTPVVAEFHFSEEKEQWMSSYRTSHDYNRVKVEMNCEIKKEE